MFRLIYTRTIHLLDTDRNLLFLVLEWYSGIYVIHIFLVSYSIKLHGGQLCVLTIMNYYNLVNEYRYILLLQLNIDINCIQCILNIFFIYISNDFPFPESPLPENPISPLPFSVPPSTCSCLQTYSRRMHQIPLQMVTLCFPCGCWELNLGFLEEQSVLLTTEPSLQSSFQFF